MIAIINIRAIFRIFHVYRCYVCVLCSPSLSITLWILSWFFRNMIGYFIVVIWQLLVTEWCHWHMSGFPRGSRLTRDDGIAAEAPAREAATVSGRCGFLSETPPSWLRVLGQSASPFRTFVSSSLDGHWSEPHPVMCLRGWNVEGQGRAGAGAGPGPPGVRLGSGSERLMLLFSFPSVATSFLLPESLLLATLQPPPSRQLQGAEEA